MTKIQNKSYIIKIELRNIVKDVKYLPSKNYRYNFDIFVNNKLFRTNIFQIAESVEDLMKKVKKNIKIVYT